MCYVFHFDSDIILSDDWIIDNDHDVLVTFEIMLEAVKQKRKAKLPHWTTSYLELSENGRDLYVRKMAPINFVPSYACFSSNDWMVLE